MKKLIIDTSSETSYIILAEGKELVFFKKIEKNNLSKELVQNLYEILNETKTDLSKIKYIAASMGPGSFTVLRIGASVCKTISFAKNIPLIGYVSLKAYIPNEEGHFLSVFDAKSEGIFILEGCQKQNKIFYLSEPKLVSIDNANKLIEKSPIIVSPDAENLKVKFKVFENKFKKSIFDPLTIINITDDLFEKKAFENCHHFNILYLRGPNHIE